MEDMHQNRKEPKRYSSMIAPNMVPLYTCCFGTSIYTKENGVRETLQNLKPPFVWVGSLLALMWVLELLDFVFMFLAFLRQLSVVFGPSVLA
mgnify:CR=1 FL=1